MQTNGKHSESFKRAILDISVDLKLKTETPLPCPPPSSHRSQRICNKREQILNSLVIHPSRVSKDLESDLNARQEELVRFREMSQNAIVSPLLTQALVKKTKELLDNITLGTPNNKVHRKFRKHAQIVRVLCGVFRNWKRYDVGLLLTIGKLQDGKHLLHQQHIARLKKSTLNITFDTRNFAIFQSKISEDVRECLMKPPYLRVENDQRKIASVLSKYKVFQMFSEEKQTAVSTLVGYERYEPGRVICLQSRNCDRFYFILSGLVSKVKTMHFAEGVKKRYLNELHQGSHTDLYETLRHEVRSYSLVCKTEVEVFLLEREDLQALFYKSENHSSIKRLLSSIELFQMYPFDKLFESNATKILFYAKNTTIETNVYDSPNFYIIKNGTCRVYMKKCEIAKSDRHLHEVESINNQFISALNYLPSIMLKRDTFNEEYVLVKTLQRSEIFGLFSLLPRAQKMVQSVAADTNNPPCIPRESTLLVSSGAECLLVNKNKFLKHSDFFTLSKLMSLEYVFPLSLKKLNQALRWRAFKEATVNKLNEEC